MSENDKRTNSFTAYLMQSSLLAQPELWHSSMDEVQMKEREQAERSTTIWTWIARLVVYLTIPPLCAVMLIHVYGMEGKYAGPIGGLIAVPLAMAAMYRIEDFLSLREFRKKTEASDRAFFRKSAMLEESRKAGIKWKR